MAQDGMLEQNFMFDKHQDSFIKDLEVSRANRKVIILGRETVGKSVLSIRYNYKHLPSQLPFSGETWYQQLLSLQGKQVQLNVLDTHSLDSSSLIYQQKYSD